MGFPGGSAVKNRLAVWESWVQSLGWEDPLEKKQLPTPVFWPREFHGLYSPWGHKELDTNERLSLSLLKTSPLKLYLFIFAFSPA